MASPEFVVQLIIEGRDEASQSLNAVYNSVRQVNESLGQARTRVLAYREEIREQVRIQHASLIPCLFKMFEARRRFVLEVVNNLFPYFPAPEKII